MDVVEGLPGESALLRRELARISDRRFARGRVHPPEGALSLAALGLMRGQGSLSAIRRFGDTRPELLAALSRILRMAKPAGVRQAMPGFTAAPSELPGARMTVASIGRQDHARCPGGRRATAVVAWGPAVKGPGFGPGADFRTPGGASGRPGMDGAGFGQHWHGVGTSPTQHVQGRR